MLIDPDVLQWIQVGKDTGVLAVVIGGAALAVKKFDRLLNVLGDYPPHRHINGKISYPHGYEPPLVESMDLKQNSNFQ